MKISRWHESIMTEGILSFNHEPAQRKETLKNKRDVITTFSNQSRCIDSPFLSFFVWNITAHFQNAAIIRSSCLAFLCWSISDRFRACSLTVTWSNESFSISLSRSSISFRRSSVFWIHSSILTSRSGTNSKTCDVFRESYSVSLISFLYSSD